MTAKPMLLTTTNVAAAAPASAAHGPPTILAAVHAHITASVKLRMLNVWMYQAYRLRIQSGTCEISGTSTSSSGGSSIAPATNRSGVVWKTWFRIVWNANSWVTAAAVVSTANVAIARHSVSRPIAGALTTTAAMPVPIRNARARGGS